MNEEKVVELMWKNTPIKLIVRSKSQSDKGAIEEIFERKVYHNLFVNMKDKVVVDAGAYIGDSTVVLSKLGAKIVYAYEPHPETFSLLKKNIAINNIKNCKLYNVALNDKKTEIKVLGRPNTSFGQGKGLYLDKKKHMIEISSISANEEFRKIIKNHDWIDIIKLDIEGFEECVIMSLDDFVFSHTTEFIIECHSKKKRDIVIETLQKKNFKIVQNEQSSRNRNLSIIRAVK